MIRRLAAILLGAALLFMWAVQINDAPIDVDAQQSVLMGYNLLHHGVISLDRAPPLYPTNYREPVPVLVNALCMDIIESVTGPAAAEDYNSGLRLRLLKYQNIVWLVLLSLGAFLVAKTHTGSFWAALAAVLAINIPLRSGSYGVVNDLMTELPATAFLIAASYALSRVFVTRTWQNVVICGALFGLLVLTKAMVFYVFPFSALIVFLWKAARTDAPRSELLRHFGLLLASYVVVLTPWIYRNHVLLGTEGISQRGGLNLYQRALQDRLSALEYAGAYYYWAPDPIKGWLGRRLGFSPSDLEQGGTLQRLNEDYPTALSAYDEKWEREGKPENSVTFYGKSRAERVRLESQLAEAGERPELIELHADETLKRRGVAMILEQPWAHMKMTVALLWRSGLRVLGLLTVVIVIALTQRRGELIVFTLPSLLTIFAYSALTTFFSRFGFPCYELALLAAAIAVLEIALKMLPGISVSHPLPSPPR